MKNTPFNVMRHREWEKSPRDPVTMISIGNAIFSAAAIQTSSLALLYATGLAATFAINAVVSWAISALTPKPDFGVGTRGLLTNIREPAAPHQYVYGEVRKGGVITYIESTGNNNKFLHQIIVLAGHEVEEIGDIYINDEVVTFAKTYNYEINLNLSGTMTINGATTQYAVDDDLTPFEINDLREEAGLDPVVTFGGTVTSVSENTTDLVDGQWNSKIRIQKFDGSQTTAPADLVAESNQVDSSFVGNGIAYLYVRLQYDQDVFANGIPLFTAKVKGKKVFDPRTSTTGYSANAALCVRDYLVSDYGMADTGSIDDTVFSAAANVCDEDIRLSTVVNAGSFVVGKQYEILTVGTTDFTAIGASTNTVGEVFVATGVGSGNGDAYESEKRYEMNGVISASLAPGDILQSMMTSCAGTLFWGQGKWQLRPGYYTAPTKTFTLDDLRGPISLSTRTSRRDNFNIVRGTFNDAAQRYITSDYPELRSAAFVTEDNNIESALDLELPFTTSAAMAQRLAKLTLFRGREQMAFSADFGLSAFDTQVGDIISLTNPRYGWVEKEFEVLGWRFFADDDAGDLRVNLSLRETSEAAFDWDAEEADIISNNTNLLSYTDVPPVGIDVVADLQVSNEKVSNIAVATVTSGRASEIDYVEVEYKRASDATYSAFGQGPLGEFRVRDLAVDTYDFRARAVNGFGYRGEFEYLAGVSINPFTGPPSDVASLTVELSGGTLFLSWPPVADLDLSHYRLKHNSQTTGATWANSSTVIERIARPGTQTTLPARAGTFLIRAYDKEGNFSDNFTAATVSPSELPPLGVTETQTEDPTFAGAKTNVIIADSALEIDDTSAASPTGEYLFAAYIDTGSERNARVTGIRTFERRFDSGTMLWDDIPGNWDTWPGNWDTWTDEGTEFGDVNVTVYVSATPDDPAGTPTWGAYVLANGAEVQGRAFRFKAVLTSDSTSFTPAITALSATVEY